MQYRVLTLDSKARKTRSCLEAVPKPLKGDALRAGSHFLAPVRVILLPQVLDGPLGTVTDVSMRALQHLFEP
jgi:hypothetical protein